MKESKDRPTANELLRHPFLEGCADQLLQSERDRKYQRQKDLNNVDGNTDGEEEDEGKYFKCERERCIAYMESTVVKISIIPPSFKPVSLSLSRISFYSKTPKQVFFLTQ